MSPHRRTTRIKGVARNLAFLLFVAPFSLLSVGGEQLLAQVDSDLLKPDGRVESNSYSKYVNQVPYDEGEDEDDNFFGGSGQRIQSYIDNFYSSQLGGYSIIDLRAIPLDNNEATAETDFGLTYGIRLGNKHPYEHFHPYMINNGSLSGVSVRLDYKDRFEVMSLYGRLSGVEILGTSIGSSASISNYATRDFPINTLFSSNFEIGDAYVELLGGSASMEFENIPVLSRWPISNIDGSIIIARSTPLEPGAEASFYGYKEDNTNRGSWKIKISSPYYVHEHVRYQRNEEGKIYSVKLRVEFVNSEEAVIYQFLDGTDVVEIDNVNKGIYKDGAYHVDRTNYCVFHFDLLDIPGGLANIKRAEVILEIANNYIVQLQPGESNFSRISTNVEFEFPADVVAVNNEKRLDNVRRYVSFEIGDALSRQMWHMRIRGGLQNTTAFNYEYSFVVNSLHRRLPTLNAEFSKRYDFAQFFKIHGDIREELFAYNANVYYVSSRYSTSADLSYLQPNPNAEEVFDDEDEEDEDINFEQFPTLVVDDDDGNGFPDGRDRNAFPRAIDTDQNAVLDWEQESLITTVLPPTFNLEDSSDNNHNYEVDFYEKDRFPEYEYSIDVLGFRGEVELKTNLRNIEGSLSFGLVDDTVLSSGQQNRDYYTGFGLRHEDNRIGELSTEVNYHLIEDNVRNDTETSEDLLLFEQSRLLTLIASQRKVWDTEVFQFAFENYYQFSRNTLVDLEQPVYETTYFSRFELVNLANNFELRNYFIYSSESLESDIEEDRVAYSLRRINRYYYIVRLILTPRALGNLILSYSYSDKFDQYEDNNNYSVRQYEVQFRVLSRGYQVLLGVNFPTAIYSGYNTERRAISQQNPLDAYNIYMQVALVDN